MTRKQLIRYLMNRRRCAEASLKSRYVHRREKAEVKIALIDDILTKIGENAKALNEE